MFPSVIRLHTLHSTSCWAQGCLILRYRTSFFTLQPHFFKRVRVKKSSEHYSLCLVSIRSSQSPCSYFVVISGWGVVYKDHKFKPCGRAKISWVTPALLFTQEPYKFARSPALRQKFCFLEEKLQISGVSAKCVR